jgi:hypothetical protein
LCLEKIAISKVIESVAGFLTITELFSPDRTIFRPETLDWRIALLRNKFFDIIGECNPKAIYPLLHIAFSHPLLFAEVLLRILANFEHFPPALFVHEPVRLLFIQTALNLEKFKSPFAVQVRSCFLEFWFGGRR